MSKVFDRLKEVATSVTTLVLKAKAHATCCGLAASWAINKTPWDGAKFNWALEQAYLEAERLGCKLSGFRRRFLIYFFVMSHIGWSALDAKSSNRT